MHTGTNQNELDDFKVFLTAQSTAKIDGVEVIDWEARKTWWIKQVKELFDMIESWIGESPNARADRMQYITSEEHMGAYETEKMHLIIGDTNMIFLPIGRNIIGARGRVDIYLKNYKQMLLLYSIEDTDSGPRHKNPMPEQTEWFFEQNRRQGSKFSPKTFMDFIVKNARR